MDPVLFWNLFMETGAPELYLLYRRALEQAEPVPA